MKKGTLARAMATVGIVAIILGALLPALASI